MGNGKGFEISPGVLNKIHSGLGDARNQIEGLGKSIPHGVEAGFLAGPLEQLLADFVDNAAQYSMSLGDLSDTVNTSRHIYETVDEHARDNIRRAHGGQ